MTRPPAVSGEVRGGKAQVAYVWNYDGNEAARAAFALTADGVRLQMYPGQLRFRETSFGPAVVALVSENQESLHERITRAATDYALTVHAVQTSHPDEGSDLGSRSLVPMTRPSVAVLTLDGVDVTAYGSFWFFFDELYRLPFTPISTEQLSSANLKRYTTIIIPDGGVQYTRFGMFGRPYGHYLRPEAADALRKWVENGGTLITIKGGTEYAAAEAGLARVEMLGRTEQTPGAIVRVKVRRQTPLTVGFPEEFYVLSRNTRVFRSKTDGGAVVFAERDLKIAGYLTDKDRDMIAGTDFLMIERLGEGRVILFGEEPNLRCQWPVLHRLLFNAMLLGPSVR